MCKRLHHVRLLLPPNHPLKYLHMRTCVWLSSIHVTAANATFLHLADNRHMTVLKLDMPKLERLLLQNCRHVWCVGFGESHGERVGLYILWVVVVVGCDRDSGECFFVVG